MAADRHEFVPQSKRQSFRKDMRGFYKKQAEREQKELAGTNERPRTHVNPAMGIPFNPGGGGGGKPRQRPAPQPSQDFQPEEEAPPPVEENLLTGENIKDPDEDDDEFADEREAF